MTDDEQLARSRKYAPEVWHFAEIRPGVFALYDYVNRRDVLITESWDEVLAVYRARPAYIPPARRGAGGIDLNSLEINL